MQIARVYNDAMNIIHYMHDKDYYEKAQMAFIDTDPRINLADVYKRQEEDARPRGYMRHIHINHGPELERSIEEVKKAISQNEDIRHKYSTRFQIGRAHV